MRFIQYFYRPMRLPEKGLGRLSFLTFEKFDSGQLFFLNTLAKMEAKDVQRMIEERTLIKVDHPIPVAADEVIGVHSNADVYVYTVVDKEKNTANRKKVGFWDVLLEQFFQEMSAA